MVRHRVHALHCVAVGNADTCLDHCGAVDATLPNGSLVLRAVPTVVGSDVPIKRYVATPGLDATPGRDGGPPSAAGDAGGDAVRCSARAD